MFQISEVQESPAFNGRRSFLTLRLIRYQTDGIERSYAMSGVLDAKEADLWTSP